MATTEKVPAIYQKIADIQKAVGAIPKNGTGPANKGSFAYIKAEDILDKVHAELVAANVIVVPRMTYWKHDTVRDQNRSYTNATVEIEYEYIAVSDGSSITVKAVGEGSDIGSDTATRKAATMALKISHLHLFTIPNTDQLSDDEGYEPAAAEAKAVTSNRAVANASKATPSTGADAKQASITSLRAKVKKAAADKKLTSTDLNKIGNDIDADFFNNAEALTKLYDQIIAGK